MRIDKDNDGWHLHVRSWNIYPLFAWYDLWIGAYYDRRGRRLYVCLLPMLGFYIQFGSADLIPQWVADSFDDPDEFDAVDYTCQRCDGRGEIVTCPDDMCHGNEECIHGDGYSTCPDCNGTGEL